MSDDSRGDGQYATDVQALLSHAVRDELAVVCGIEGLEVPDLALTRLAEAVVARIDYAFRYRWDPTWVKDEDPHTWSENGAFFARCNVCLAASAAAATRDAPLAWYADHRANAHSR